MLCISEFHLSPVPAVYMSVSGVGHLQIALPWRCICQPRGHSQAFDTHAVSYQNITAQKVLLEKRQIDSSVKDRNKLNRVVKACSRFYACNSSLLIKPEFHSEIEEIIWTGRLPHLSGLPHLPGHSM